MDFPDEPIEIEEGDRLAVSFDKGQAQIHVGPEETEIPAGAWWNAIARAWFVNVDGETLRLDPQPPAPNIKVRGCPVPPGPRVDL